mgnify:CR=1 FL=1
MLVAADRVNDGELAQISQAQEIPYNRKTCTVLGPLDVAGVAQATGAAFVSVSGDGQSITVTTQPQSDEGNYTLMVGPDVTDLAGNALDQDGDDVGGDGETEPLPRHGFIEALAAPQGPLPRRRVGNAGAVVLDHQTHEPIIGR